MVGLLLTRSRENNYKLREKLREFSNIEFFEEEIIKYSPKIEVIKNLKAILHNNTILITSIYAAQLVAEYLENNNLSAYVVGEESKNILKKKNIKIIDYAENIETLLEKLDINFSPIYLRGNIISSQIPNIKNEYIIYETEYISEFSTKILDAIKSEKIQFVSLFSKKTAEIFLTLIKNSNLERFCKKITFLCFSKNISQIMKDENLQSDFSKKSDLESFVKLFKSKF